VVTITMMMTLRDDDLPWPADPDREAATLVSLQAEFPAFTITNSFYGHTRAWVAQGHNGHPWLVMSNDLRRFRAALRDE
jgi:hypothetical protein